MAVRLTVKQRSEAGGADKGTEVLLDDDVINLGRDKSCQVVLAQMAVSRTHARITRDGSLFFVEDLGSAYGTTINGKALPKGEKRLLRNGDLIAIAQFDVTFDRIADQPAQGSSEKTSFIARHVVKDVMRGLGSGEGPYFRVMNGPREGQRIEIQDAQEIVIGREEGVDVVLKDDLVSRRHVKIRRDWSGTHVEDLGSRNGIKVNKKKVSRKTLKDRDELEVGAIRLLYLDPSEVRETPLVLSDEEEGEGTNPPSEEPAAEEPPNPEPSEEMKVAADEAPAEEPAAEESSQAEEPAAEESSEEGGEEASEEEASGDEESSEDEAQEEGGEEEESSDEEEEAEEAPSKKKGGKDKAAAALKNITDVAKDTRRLVPIVVVGVVALLALVLVIALFAGA